MAFLAKCTIPQVQYKYKPLFYKDLLKNPYWHNHCTSYSMPFMS